MVKIENIFRIHAICVNPFHDHTVLNMFLLKNKKHGGKVFFDIFISINLKTFPSVFLYVANERIYEIRNLYCRSGCIFYFKAKYPCLKVKYLSRWKW